MAIKTITSQGKLATVSVEPAFKKNYIKNVPLAVVLHILSFLPMKSSEFFKRTRFEYLDLSRIEAHFLISPSSFCAYKLSKMIAKWTSWSQDRIKGLVVRNTLLQEKTFYETETTCPTQNRLEDIDEEKRTKAFQFLAEIKIESIIIKFVSNIDDVAAAELSQISTLKAVHLGLGCKISDLGIEHLSKLPLHTFFLMDASRLTTYAFQALGKMPLKSLTLGCIRLNREDLTELCGLKGAGLSSLQELSVGIAESDIEWLIGKMPQLQKINGRKVRPATYLNKVIFRVFKEEMLGFLEHPRDDSRLRQTCAFFHFIYPKCANLVLSPWPDRIRWCDRNDFSPRPTKNLSYFKYAIQLYQSKGSRINSIQACIGPRSPFPKMGSPFPKIEISSLRKLDLEFSSKNPRHQQYFSRMFQTSSSSFFSGLQKTSLTELSLTGPINSIPDESWFFLNPLRLKVLSLIESAGDYFDINGMGISETVCQFFQRMPIEKLTLSGRKDPLNDFPTLSHLLPSLKRFTLLRELNALGIQNKRWSTKIRRNELELFARTLGGLQIINRRLIKRDGPEIQLGEVIVESEPLIQYKGKPSLGDPDIHDYLRSNFLAINLKKNSREQWKQRRATPIVFPLENTSSLQNASPAEQPFVAIQRVVDKSVHAPSTKETPDPKADATVTRPLAAKEEQASTQAIVNSDPVVHPAPVSISTQTSTSQVDETLNIAVAAKEEQVSTQGIANSDPVANPASVPKETVASTQLVKQSSGGIGYYLSAFFAAISQVFIDLFAWVRGLWSRSSSVS